MLSTFSGRIIGVQQTASKFIRPIAEGSKTNNLVSSAAAQEKNK